ncbi:MAG: amidohydrolase family protein, partial [Pseudomonadota bacterium]|nr:amidohydrolase family protein [Pseudomonadota bacterium]
MGMRLTAAIVIGGLCLPAWANGAADRILVNGRVLTVDAADRVAEAIAIRDGRILAVGTTAEIERLAGPGTDRIDLAGRTATPGLIDAHAHFSSGGLLRLTNIDLSFPQVKGIADIVRLAGERASSAQAGDWILGRGWDEGKLAERRLVAAADLDPVTAGHPAWLVQTSGHYGVANSVALEIAGVTRATPDPPGGTIDRDADGNPTGILKESAMGLVSRHAPKA